MNKFFDNYTVYYINLEKRPDRNQMMINQFDLLGIKNVRINAITPEDPDFKKDIPSWMPAAGPGSNNNVEACTKSHFKALKEWLENSSDEYAFILEDDVDLSLSKRIDFNANEMINKLPKDFDAVQLVSNGHYDNFLIHERQETEFSASLTLFKRSYAKQILYKHFKDDVYNFENYLDVERSHEKSKMSTENIVYQGKIYSIKLFNNFPDAESNMGFYEWSDWYHNIQNDNYNIMKKYWSKHEKVTLEDIGL